MSARDHWNAQVVIRELRLGSDLQASTQDKRSKVSDDMIAFRGLMQKSADADLLRKMIGFAAQRLMELEVGQLTGAAHDEKNSERLIQRNGYLNRDRESRAGTVELRIPKLRKGSYFRSYRSRGGWPRRRGPL